MTDSSISFDKFAHDAHNYLNYVAEELEHPEEKQRVLIIWRSVMHTVRDRIHLGESFQIVDNLPMIFKGIFVENWNYSEKPRLNYDSLEQMKNEVKKLQAQKGEEDFPWKKSTEEIIAITLNSLKKFMSESHLEEVINQMPKEIKEYLTEKV